MDILEGLNPEQQRAARHFKGPALVLAGPGSGKTRTVVHRIAYLVRAYEVPSWQILAVTFTNKAAEEMKQRLSSLLPKDQNSVRVTTFHGLGAAMLLSHESYRDWRIIAAGEGERALIEAARGSGLRMDTKQARIYLSAISKSKNADWDVDELVRMYADLSHLKEVYHAYIRYKAERKLLDFDDLLHRAYHLLRSDEEALRKWRARARFVLVDEYQDTNRIQYRLIRLLLSQERNIMVVGDPNQAIYSWRGADRGLILSFQEEFPNAQTYTLSANYRSHSGIIAAARGVLPTAISKPLREGEPPLKVTAKDTEAEALFVSEAVREIASRGIPLEDVAILIRSQWQSREIESALGRAGIPYHIVGIYPFWRRREVRVFLDLLQAGQNPEALVSILAAFLPRVGVKRAQSMVQRRVTPEVLERFGDGGEMIREALTLHTRTGKELAAATRRFFDEWSDLFEQYTEYLSDGDKDEAEERMDNIREAISALEAFAEEEPGCTARDFVNQVALAAGEDVDRGGVRIMTVHRSKGMEFHAVFVVGLAEGIFPPISAIRSENGLDEEQRLAYVAYTRAKEELYLSYPKSSRWRSSTPSDFFEAVKGRELEYDPAIGYHGVDKSTALQALLEL